MYTFGRVVATAATIVPMAEPPANHHAPRQPRNTAIDVVQSLLVAFVLAMTFRGFVAEGFVIPTGSMAPTLMGEHLLIDTPHTGWSYRVGLDTGHGGRRIGRRLQNLADPMLGPSMNGSGRPTETITAKSRRMGDRILVLKTIYPFNEPDRYDVVVFKNPTDPDGPSANYIKRLIGLPNETVWLADGDVFAKADGEDKFNIKRKPEHVQRAVFQTVYHSDYVPIERDRLSEPYPGQPWIGEHWQTNNTRAYRCKTAERTTLEWSNNRHPVTDWLAYNQLKRTTKLFPVSDVRVKAGIVADQPGLHTTFRLIARSHIFEFSIADNRATVRMRPDAEGEANWTTRTVEIDPLPAGRAFDVEFWHVDQRLGLFLNGDEVVSLEYDWTPEQRLRYATGVPDQQSSAWLTREPNQPALKWHFEGSPVTLHRVQLDRDLYYRPDHLKNNAGANTTPISQNAELVRPNTPAFGTHPDKLAELGPDHFFMCGDNSAASLDSRLWGNPAPLVATQIDPAPFVVNRKLLLGKAWVVYFPAPYSLNEGGTSFIPDFGRLRFIR